MTTNTVFNTVCVGFAEGAEPDVQLHIDIDYPWPRDENGFHEIARKSKRVKDLARKVRNQL